MDRRHDDSWGFLDWMELADTVFDLGGCAVEVAWHVAEGAFELAGALFSLLDGF